MDTILWFVGLAGFLVPAAIRRSWVREWESEIRYAARELAMRGHSGYRFHVQLWKFGFGCWADAAWHALQERELLSRALRVRLESPVFCLAALTAVIGILVLLSGFLPVTRDVVAALPYSDARRIATVAQSSIVAATRSAVRSVRVPWWRTHSRTVEAMAEYTWRSESNGDLTLHVDEGFFALLGVRTVDGKTLDAASLRHCKHCVLLSHDYWREHYRDRPFGRGIAESSNVIGVLEPDFWFLSRRIAMWVIVPGGARDPKSNTGLVVKLHRGVSAKEAEAEFASIAEYYGVHSLDALVEILPLQARVRSVFGSFALALGLACVIIATTMRGRLPAWSLRTLCFFGVKTTLALAVILLAGLEFTRAASVTMLGGTDLSTEPVSTWLFLMGCLGVLTWSIHDQSRRCRTCLRRLGLAAHVGCSGSVLLDWAGTELVCIEGHGMLHVPEMASSWREPERWTTLDDSWMGLFARRS